MMSLPVSDIQNLKINLKITVTDKHHNAFSYSCSTKCPSSQLFASSIKLGFYRSLILAASPTINIITNTGFYPFSLKLIASASPTIRQEFAMNPQKSAFHFDIDDPLNVMEKFQRLFQLDTITFTQNELPTVQRITEALGIVDCPSFMKSESFFNEGNIENQGITICPDTLKLIINSWQPFIIQSNGKEYPCNPVGVNASNVIKELRKQDFTLNTFVCDLDENDDFSLIQHLFNFVDVPLDTKSIYFMYNVAKKLDIENIVNSLESSIHPYNNLLQIINEEQDNISMVENLFTWLYDIPHLTTEGVGNLILNSPWIQTEENVQELVSCILQVIRTNINSHSYILELLLYLDKSANETNKLDILLPHFTKQILILFPSYSFYCAFLYRMYKMNLISFDTIHQTDGIKALFSNNSDWQIYNVLSWFLPEMKDDLTQLTNYFNDAELNSCLNHYYSNIQEYEQVRDTFESTNQVIRLIQHDNVDELQSFLGQSPNLAFCPEPMLSYCWLEMESNIKYYRKWNTKLSLINHAAIHGSVNCFKFLLSNHATIELSSLFYAVVGGNLEIIRAVYSYLVELRIPNQQLNEILTDSIIPAIVLHRYSVFDWILEQFTLESMYIRIYHMIPLTLKNGNIHTLISFIRKGFDCISDMQNDNLLVNCSKSSLNYSILFAQGEKIKKNSQPYLLLMSKGFYRYLKLIQQLTQIKHILVDGSHMANILTNPFIRSGNLSIFKMFQEYRNFPLVQLLQLAIKYDYFNIVKEILTTNHYSMGKYNIVDAYSSSIQKKTSDMFDCVVSFIPIEESIQFIPQNMYIKIIADGCNFANFGPVRQLTETVLNLNPNIGFTWPFANAASCGSEQICQYFLSKNVKLRFISIINGEYLMNVSSCVIPITQSIEGPMKNHLLSKLLDQSIFFKKKELIEYLLQFASINDNSIRASFLANDLEIFNLVLHHVDDPSLFFQNRLSNHFVTRLKAFSCFLDYYGEKLQLHVHQINKIIHLIFSYCCRNNQFDQSDLLDVIRSCSKLQNVQVNIYYGNDTFLIWAIKHDYNFLAQGLIGIENIDVNLEDLDNRLSPLHWTILKSNQNIFNLLLESPRIDLNDFQFEDVLKFLNPERLAKPQFQLLFQNYYIPLFSHLKPTRLSFYFYKAGDGISKYLQSVSNLDVNYVSTTCGDLNSPFRDLYLFDTSLIQALRHRSLTKIMIILNHPTFDPVTSNANAAIFIAICMRLSTIFSELLKFVDVNICNLFGDSLLLGLSKEMNRPEQLSTESVSEYFEILTKIINHDAFDPTKSHFVESFFNIINILGENQVNSINDKLIDIVKIMFVYNKNHSNLVDLNKPLPNGKSIFTLLENEELIGGLVPSLLTEWDVDPNILDSYGISPLEHAIKIKSIVYVHYLFTSDRIDLTKKFDSGETYLHLMASLHAPFSCEFIKQVLTAPLYDINGIDNLGETPLMKACRNKNEPFIETLFNYPTLDYTLKNQKGEDALTLYVNSSDFPSSHFVNLLSGKRVSHQPSQNSFQQGSKIMGPNRSQPHEALSRTTMNVAVPESHSNSARKTELLDENKINGINKIETQRTNLNRNINAQSTQFGGRNASSRPFNQALPPNSSSPNTTSTERSRHNANSPSASPAVSWGNSNANPPSASPAVSWGNSNANPPSASPAVSWGNSNANPPSAPIPRRWAFQTANLPSEFTTFTRRTPNANPPSSSTPSTHDTPDANPPSFSTTSTRGSPSANPPSSSTSPNA